MFRLTNLLSAISRRHVGASISQQRTSSTTLETVELKDLHTQGVTGSENVVYCPKCQTPLAVKLAQQYPEETVSSSETEPNAYSFDLGITLQTAGLKQWKDDRILIDSLQNHVDETRITKAKLWLAGEKDKARALQVGISFILRNGQIVSYLQAKNMGILYKHVKSIVFSDKGEGYPHAMLKYVLSHGKTAKENRQFLDAYEQLGIDPPGGQFGEGQKMVAAAILKLAKEQEKSRWFKVPEDKRPGLVYQSKNWEAILYEEPVVISKGSETINTSSVGFNVVNKQESIEGSRTIILNPTEEIFSAVLEVDNYILDFDYSLNKIAKSSEGYAFKRKSQNQCIFVKGYYINSGAEFIRSSGLPSEVNSPLFSYNLKNVSVNRDRNQENAKQTLNAIGHILFHGATKDVMKAIIYYAKNNPASYGLGTNNSYHVDWILECEALKDLPLCWIDPKQKALWLEAYYECFGSDAVLASSSDLTSDSYKRAKEANEKLVVLNYPLFRMFHYLGVKTDLEYAREIVKEYRLGLSLDYEEDKWGPLRIVLDFLQNHADAARVGSSLATAEFQLKGSNKWLPYLQIQNHKNEDIDAIRFRDELESGYDHNYLHQIGSKKKTSSVVQVGEKGEGLKIASAASVRLGMNVILCSQNWIADAHYYEVAISSGEKFEDLCFTVYKSKTNQGGSETIVTRPSKEGSNEAVGNSNFNEVLQIVRDLKKYVLRHKELGLSKQDFVSTEITSKGAVVSTERGDIYIKDFFITDGEKDRLVFSYNFNNLDINRDRDIAKIDDLKEVIGGILSEIRSKDLVARIIRKAVEDQYGKYHEFQDLTEFAGFDRNAKILWLNVFKEMYCKDQDTVLKSDQGGAEAEARFIGYKVLNVNKEIAKVLRAAGIFYDSEVISFECSYIKPKALSQKEKDVLEVAKLLDDNQIVFPEKLPTEYRVFECAVNKVDKKPMPQILGCADINSRNFIAFKRETLGDGIKFLNVYLEEKAHQLSGASDGTRQHFNKLREGAVWLIKNLTGNSSQAIRRLREVFPNLDIERLTLEIDSNNNLVKLIKNE